MKQHLQDKVKVIEKLKEPLKNLEEIFPALKNKITLLKEHIVLLEILEEKMRIQNDIITILRKLNERLANMEHQLEKERETFYLKCNRVAG